MTPWPDFPVRRACVNSFGFGGANACCILDDAESVLTAYSGISTSWSGNGDSVPELNCALNGVISHSRSLQPPGTIKVPLLSASNEFSDSQQTDKDNVNTLTSISTMNVDEQRSEDFSLTNGSNFFNSAPKLENAANADTLGPQCTSEDTARIQRELNSIFKTPVFSRISTKQTRSLVLLPFSSHDDFSLKANIGAIRDIIQEHEISDLAYTLSSRRSRFFQRGFAVVDAANATVALDPGAMKLEKCPNPQTARICFVFSGQGTQWAEMGAGLLREFAVFRASIRYQDTILAKLSVRPTWRIEEVLLTPSATSRIHEPLFSQTACTALQIALVDLLRSWKVRPVVTVGHSAGEIAAAYAAGIHTSAEAIIVAYLRGYVISGSKRSGLMLAVGLSSEAVRPYLQGKEDEVKVAAVNSPENVTLSGDTSAIKELMSTFEAEQVFSRIVKTGEQAYHSHHMTQLGEEYERLANQCIGETTSSIPIEPHLGNPVLWQSSVNPQYRNLASPGPSYWRANMVLPVLFYPAVKCLLEDQSLKIDVVVEIGPHPALHAL